LIEVEVNLLTEDKQKVQEQNKKIIEENTNNIISFNNISFRLNEAVTTTELIDCVQYSQNKIEKKPKFSLWDNGVEGDNSFVVDFGFGMNANMIILHGINNKNERLCKINRYIDIIEEIYNNNNNDDEF
jgi:enolase